MILSLQSRNCSLTGAWSEPLHGVGGGGKELLTLWVLYEGDIGMRQNSVGILFLIKLHFCAIRVHPGGILLQ